MSSIVVYKATTYYANGIKDSKIFFGEEPPRMYMEMVVGGDLELLWSHQGQHEWPADWYHNQTRSTIDSVYCNAARSLSGLPVNDTLGAHGFTASTDSIVFGDVVRVKRVYNN